MTVDPNRRGPLDQSPSDLTQWESLPKTDAQGATRFDAKSTAPQSEPASFGPRPLEHLGAYKILRELGSGGMGTVYEATDQILGRRVALKVMKTGLPGEDESKKRFLREAQSAAAVTHDHIVTIYQVGEDRGTPFLAMQLLEGESLEHRLDRGEGFRVEEVIRVGAQIADGLSAAHQRGLIHRDIKPANIWLEAPRGRVKILDFGLARGNDASTAITQSGIVMGTPAYMSPEQANGDKLDARSDLFSLGCILYELCTGTRPFDGPTFMAIVAKLATSDPPPVKELNPAVPRSLSDLISRLLSRNRDDRPESAAEVAALLERLDLTDAAPTFFNTPSVSSLRPTPVPYPRSMPSLPTRPAATSGPALPSLPAFTSFNVPPELDRAPGTAVPQSHTYPAVNNSFAGAEPRSGGGGGFFKFMLFLLILAGGGYLVWTQILDLGTLIIETEDSKVEVDISQHGQTKAMSITKRQFELRPGEYDLKLLKNDRGQRLEKDKVSVERGKTTTVRVSQ